MTNLDEISKDLQRLKRELRRLKFQVEGPMRGTCACVERVIEQLCKRCEALKKR